MTEKEQHSIFAQWLGRHKALIFKIVRAYAFTAMDRDDLFQEIVMHVWHSIPRFREESAVTTWLYRISLNTAISWTRKERKHSNARESLDHVHILDENKNPVEDQSAWLYEEIARLDEIDRSITLLLLDGLSYKEMAAIIGITESNLGVKINRIKKYLITQSKRHYHGI